MLLMPDDLERFHGMSLEDFLAGGPAHRRPLKIDDSFACTLDGVLRRHIDRYGQTGLAPCPHHPVTPCLTDPGLCFVSARGNGLFLVAPGTGKIHGVFVGCWLTVAKHAQGRGLGPELLIEYLLRGASYGPRPGAAYAGFTPGGVRNRARALDLLQDPAYRARKRQALAMAAPEPIRLDLSPFGGRLLEPGDDGDIPPPAPRWLPDTMLETLGLHAETDKETAAPAPEI